MPKVNIDNAFYLRALPKSKGTYNVLYYNKAMGRESLGNVVKNIIHRKAGFDGHFKNHSIRRSCATRLYEGGVPEQVIVKTTGHQSWVREYKCTSSTLKQKASEILQGLRDSKTKVEMAGKEQ